MNFFSVHVGDNLFQKRSAAFSCNVHTSLGNKNAAKKFLVICILVSSEYLWRAFVVAYFFALRRKSVLQEIRRFFKNSLFLSYVDLFQFFCEKYFRKISEIRNLWFGGSFRMYCMCLCTCDNNDCHVKDGEKAEVDENLR